MKSLMGKKLAYFLVCLNTLLTAATACAAPSSDIDLQQQILQQKEQELAAKQAEQALQQRVKQGMSKTPAGSTKLEVVALPEEVNSFKIKNFTLKAASYGYKFNWITDYLANYNGESIGVQGINLLLQNINKEIMNRGYVTTRVYVEPQDLSSGTMYFTLLPGIISDIRFREETWGTWHNAVAMRKGSLLNIRDIEQTVDNFNSVPSQSADIKIEPGPNEGESDLVIDIKRGKPWSLSMTLDNSGTRETGKVQMSGAVQLAQPFSANDIFYASWNSDATQSGETKGTRANSFYYAVPLGKERFAFSHSKNDYHQTVEYAVNPFVSSGEFTSDSLTWTHLLQRNQSSKTDFELGLVHKTRHSYIDGTEIEVQRQKTTSMQVGFNHRQYLGPSVLNASVKWQKGLPWYADAGPTDGMSGEATTQYNMYLISANFATPVPFGDNYDAQYNVSIRGQKSDQRIYGSEFFSIGGWYSVRGFDGEQTLSAEDGITIRNELRFPIEKYHQLYLALDYGKVSGPSAEYLLGTELVGSAIGLRGQIGPCNYDAFVGWPLKKPDGFTCAARTYGFMLTAQI